ncbi:putative major facilitator superfamily protein [Diaporthe ampelina]|uniref:Putative major facilitator superfamily protein n=1 Tax=Diaporthe ampelina TaxID=1214573 RepID=A0A0G2F9B9_9PEZI|nr:putative major facilitator superfamily protein [Diaporthe ampelina]
MIPLPTPELQNLRKLYLYEITGDLGVWMPKIATMLGKSRFLEELGLSLSAECERQHALAGKSKAFLNFFPSLVERYRDQGDEPLRLRVLKLGYGVLLNTPPGDLQDGDPACERDEYLSFLTQAEYLEELYVNNDLDVGCPLKIRTSVGRIAWSWITPSFLPNLKRFTFTSLSVRSQAWLGKHLDPTFAESLAMGIGTEKLAFSYIDEHGSVQSVRDNNIHWHIGQIAERTFFLHKYPNHPSLPLKSSVISILKPCHKDLVAISSCSWIKTLSICLQKQTAIPALRKIAQTLPSTEHLWIRVGMDYPLVNGQNIINTDGCIIFTSREKCCIVAMISYASWSANLSTFIFLPALKTLSEVFEVSVDRINLIITVYMAVGAVVPLFVGDAADVLGRRAAYVVTLFFFATANLCLALADSNLNPGIPRLTGQKG